MDLKKQIEFFNPTTNTEEIHVIGLGAVGSTICEMLTRMGIEEVHTYDFDAVSPHNLANQMFSDKDIGQSKTNAVFNLCHSINPQIKHRIHELGYKPGMRLSGHVFLAVDNIELRKAIAEEHLYNPTIKGFFDFRMGLTEAQHFAANWTNETQKKQFLSTMQFTNAEAKEAMPVSACGLELNVIPTVRTIVSYGLANWMNMVRNNTLKNIILLDVFHQTLTTF